MTVYGQVGVQVSGGSNADNSFSSSIGQTFFGTAEGCGGIAQNGVQQGDFSPLNFSSSIATTDTSDAYITVSWSLLESCFKQLDNQCMPYPDGVLVELTADGERIYSDIIYDADGLLTDSYRHFVGPSQTVVYELNVFIRGSGMPACSSLGPIMGSTLDYQPPTGLMATDGLYSNKVELSWTNNSQLTSTVFVYRESDNGENVLIASVPGTENVDTEITYVDEFQLGDSLNLVNGQEYTYCIQTYNEELDDTFGNTNDVCDQGSTQSVGLQAIISASEVDLLWSDVSDFAASLNLYRDGILINTFPGGRMDFTDEDPTFGSESIYELDLLDANDNILVRVADTVSLPAIGSIAGFVRTPQFVGLKDLTVSYRVVVRQDTINASTTTDYRGFYQFDEVYYGRMAEFRVSVGGTDDFTFTDSLSMVMLDNLNPTENQVNFISDQTVTENEDASFGLSIDTILTSNGVDELIFDWEYTTTNNLDPPVHFQLFRENTLIDITDDTQPDPLQLIDRTGSAGFIYKYTLVGYAFVGDLLVRDSKVIMDTVPATTAPGDLLATNNFDMLSNNVITLSWTHSSDNFDGFRLYRSDDLIADIEPSQSFFYDYYATPGESFNYELAAYRLSSDGDPIESLRIETNPAATTIPSLPVPTGLMATPVPEDNAVELSWNLPAGTTAGDYDNLSGFIVYSNGQPIKRLIKSGENYLFRDYNGKSGNMYSLAPYLYTADGLITGPLANFPVVTYPNIAQPEIASVNPNNDYGYLEIVLDDSYVQNNQNFDGYILSDENEDFDTLRPYEFIGYYTPNATGGMNDINLSVRAFRVVDGDTLSSGMSSFMSQSLPAQTSSGLASPTNFTATEHIPMHVTLKWDYPDFIFATFMVYKNGIALDTLPTEARCYYDYDAVPGQRSVYSIRANFESNNSFIVSDEGMRRGQYYVQGQVLTQDYASDKNKIAVELRDASDNAFLARTFTDSAGYFSFEQLHDLVADGSWQVSVNGNSSGHVFAQENILLVNNQKGLAFFEDEIPLAAAPPLPLRDSLARVRSFESKPLLDENALVTSWDLSEGIYDGSELSRSLTGLAAIERGQPTFVVDSSGVSNIDYTYLLSPYSIENGDRNTGIGFVGDTLRATYSELTPVEYLSGLAAVNDLANSITLQWSHLTGKVTYYEIQRNGLPLALVSGADQLIFVDTTGKPDQRYVYQVRAVRVNNGNIVFSNPRTITLDYPTVARPNPFTATPKEDINSLLLEWEYQGDAIDGFRIFRNGEVIATVADTSRTFFDLSGYPGSNVSYEIIALLNRGGMDFQSRPSVASAVYPDIKPPYDLEVAVNEELGLIEGSFKYNAANVDRFYVYRRRTIPQTQRELVDVISYEYDSTEQHIQFVDLHGLPTFEYEYLAVAEGDVEFLSFQSADAMLSGPPVAYPRPPVVQSLTLSGGNSNWVDMEWGLPLEANIDGFVIYRLDGVEPEGVIEVPAGQNTSTDGLPVVRTIPLAQSGKRKYQSVFSSLVDAPIGTFSYVIASYRDVTIDGQDIRSESDGRTGNTSLGNDSPILWAAGNGAVSNYRNGSILGWTGLKWEAFGQDIPNGVIIEDIWGANSNNVWAVGGNGTIPSSQERIFYWDGSTWEEQLLPGSDESLFGVWGLDEKSVWAVGEDGIYFWNGLQWNKVDDEPRLRGIWGANENNIWAFADNGTVMFYNGGTWEQQANLRDITGITNPVTGIWGTDKDNVWIVGRGNNDPNNGVIYKWDGQEWRELTGNSPVAYDAVWSADDNLAWGVGANGKIARTNANGTILQPNDDTDNLYAVWGENANRIWAVGQGRISRFNGQVWSNQQGNYPAAIDINNVALNTIGTSIPLSVGSVSASDGTFANRTRIEWNFSGDPDRFDGFNVYRDNELIATVSPSISFYSDSDGIPGQSYVYTVRVKTVEEEYPGKSDTGFTRGNGELSGEVVTLMGSAPVAGALLEAEATIDGERYTYTTFSDNSGQFVLDGLFIGEEPVNYTISVSFEDHEFVQEEQTFSLSPQNSSRANIFFLDKTAYAVVGNISHIGGCAIDSIEVVAKQKLSDGSTVLATGTTDSEGNYSIIIDPNLGGLEEIVVEPDTLFLRNQGSDSEGRILHRFSPATQNVPFPVQEVTTLNFIDTFTYQLDVKIRNVCGFAASENGRFSIELSTIDGCYLRTEQTNPLGNLSMRIPPLDGYILRVVGATPLTLENNLVVNYLENRPTTVELADFHLKNGGVNDDGLFELIVPDTVVERTLVYHRAATIDLLSEFGDRPACDPEQPRFIEQGNSYSIKFGVTEEHQGEDCFVNEGYIIVNNAAADENSRDTLFYNATRNDFPTHSFVGGTPNIVFPYRKGISIQYFSEIGDLLAERIIPVVVLGASQLPGSDIIVDVKDDQGQVKLPIYVLRDPPGDGSFSSIAEGRTITKSLTDVFTTRGAAGGEAELLFSFGSVGGGTYLNLSVSGGKSRETERSYEFSVTTEQTISTSSSDDFVGPDADVLVGIGVAIQYGLVEDIRFDNETCEFEKVQTIDISPNEIKTDWLYTVGQIDLLVEERKRQIDSIAAGILEIQVGGELLSPEEATARLETELNNWEQILDYHNRLSVPYYQLCDQNLDPDRLWSEVLFYNKESEYSQGIGVFGEEVELPVAEAPSEFRARVQFADLARRVFCTDPAIGSYNAQGDFSLNGELEDIVFTTNLAEKYEDASRAVEYYLDSLYLSFDEVQDRLGLPEQNTFIPRVENTTFSAGVEIEKSVSTSRTTSSSLSQRGFFEVSAAYGFANQGTSAVGFGVFMDVFQTDSKAGVTAELSFEWGSDYYAETSEESAFSYTLSDDDPGDQFSVTAIRPRDPGHTPYFQLLGGRSSCPPEEGTILRDRVKIDLFDLENQSVLDFQPQFNLDPDEPATYYVQLTNQNPFGEARDIGVYHEGESNENGAIISLNGIQLGAGSSSAEVLTSINSFQPVILPLTLERSVNNYQFDEIFIVAQPGCGGEADSVAISANFDSPCSDITISSPGNDWRIFRRNPNANDETNREALVINLQDYDPENEDLEEVWLEYRRIGDGSGFRLIPSVYINPADQAGNGDFEYPFTKEYLATLNAGFEATQTPVFPVTFDITEAYDAFPDGEYEIRAIASCGVSGVTQSNVIRGRILRNINRLVAQTSPFDGGIWRPAIGANNIPISLFNFSRPVDCFTFAPPTFEVYLKDDPNMVLAGNLECLGGPNNRTLNYNFAPQDMMAFEGQILEARVSNLRNENGQLYYELAENGDPQLDGDGNRIPKTFTWEFEVISRDIYLLDDVLEITVISGSQASILTRLQNISNNFGEYTFDNVDDFEWLMASPSEGQYGIGEIIDVLLSIDASDPEVLPVGQETITLTVLGGPPNNDVDELTLIVNVLPKPPYWVVDPSQFSDQAVVVVNYEYKNDLGVYSEDEMDLISVWVDNEIRGVAPIRNYNASPSSASIAVYSNPEEIEDAEGNLISISEFTQYINNPDGSETVIPGKPLEFRVWDSSRGTEYNAYPNPDPQVGIGNDTIYLDKVNRIGTIGEPEILQVNTLEDRARYIPVNGEGDGEGGAVTWISFNSQENDNSPDALLRSLTAAQNGDVIKNAKGNSALYDEQLGWYSTNGLGELSPEDGYILILQGVDDTIRVTGKNAVYDTIGLKAGWNLIGFPLQQRLEINAALQVLNGTWLQNDFIITIPQDPDNFPDGNGDPTFGWLGNYTNGMWLGSNDYMEELRPNFAYQVRLFEPTVLNYPGSITPLTTTTPTSSDSRMGYPAFHPADPSTWYVDPSEYPNNMVVTGILEIDNIQSYDEADRIAAFVNGECRGVAPLYEVSALGQNIATLFIYGYGTESDIDILIYDASEDQVYLNEEPIEYEINGLIGNFSEPYLFANQSRAAVFESIPANCAVDATGALEVVLVTGLEEPYTYQWSTGDTTDYLQQLTAGEYAVTITGQLGLTVVDSVEVFNQQTAIPLPSIETSADNLVCLGADVALYALPPLQDAQVYWYDEAGQLLAAGENLILEDISAATSVYAQTDYLGCLSDPQWISLEVYQPNSGFTVDPTQDITNDTQISFTPETESGDYEYSWAFGDGNSSSERTPTYLYELPGMYTVSLEVADETGCVSPLSSYELWVEAATNVLELESGKLSLEAMPNPFSSMLRAAVEVPTSGTYQLQLHNMQGQLIQQYEYDLEPGLQHIPLEVGASDGVYLLSLEHENGARVTIPVIKQFARP
jgi:hypothetical protein